MSLFLTLVVSGAVAGSIYSLIATGLLLTYTSTGVFNLAYAAVAYLSAYVYYELHVGLHWRVAPAALMVLIGIGVGLGYAFHTLIFRRLRGANEAAKLTATIGLLIALPAIAQFIVTTGVDSFGWGIPNGLTVYLAPGLAPVPPVTWHLWGDIPITSDQVAVLSAAALCAVCLWLFMYRTRVGLQMRAIVDSPRQAQLSGVDADRVPAFAWIIGTFMAALAGVVAAPIFNSLDTGVYTTTVFVATAAVAVGRFRSIPWAFAGGLAIGIVQNLVAGYASFAKNIPGFSNAVPFVVLLVALLLLGRTRGRRASISAESENVTLRSPATDTTSWTWRRLIVGGALLALYLVYLAHTGQYWLAANISGLALALIFLSFVLITGMGGLLNLAPAAFVTTAGLAMGVAVNRYHLPWLVGVILAIAAALVVGLLVAVPALRLGGLILGLATLAMAYMADTVLFNWPWFIDLPTGWPIRRPKVGTTDLVGKDRVLAVVMIGVIAVVALIIANLHRSMTGRAVFAVRNSETGASASGISPVKTKLVVFAAGSAVAALGGTVLATYSGNASAGVYTTGTGLTWFAAVVLWGVRRPAAAIAAGMLASLFPALLQGGFHFPEPFNILSWNGTTSAYIPSIVFGLGALQMASEPDGVFAMFAKQRDARRRRKARRVPSGSSLTQTPVKVSAISNRLGSASAIGHVDTAPDAAGKASRSLVLGAAAIGDLSSEVLRLEGICAGYGELQVLDGVNLTVRPGSITALVGANGAGKSTLCSVIAGFLPVTSGRVVLAGTDITTERVHRRIRAGLFCTPESRGIFPGLSVRDNLRLRLDPEGIRVVLDRFPQLAVRVNVAERDLSGGEQQILSLAPVLVNPPKVLIADEPMLGLAPQIVNVMADLFKDLRRAGTSVLLVEEKAKSILKIADQVAFLELGSVVWSGPAADVDQEALLASYLGRPKKLFRSPVGEG